MSDLQASAPFRPPSVARKVIPLIMVLLPVVFWVTLPEALQLHCEGPATGDLRCVVTQGPIVGSATRQVVLHEPVAAAVSSQRAGRKGPFEYELDIRSKSGGSVRLVEPIESRSELREIAPRFDAFLARGGGTFDERAAPSLGGFVFFFVVCLLLAVGAYLYWDKLWHRKR